MNINNLPLVEELSDEQTTNIIGGMDALTLETGGTPGGSKPGIKYPPPPPPKDEEVSVYFSL